jgi:hypothetical protein
MSFIEINGATIHHQDAEERCLPGHREGLK